MLQLIFLGLHHAFLPQIYFLFSLGGGGGLGDETKEFLRERLKPSLPRVKSFKEKISSKVHQTSHSPATFLHSRLT